LVHFRNNTAEGGIPVSVNDRRPYILRATVSRPGTNPIALTVIVNHLRSLIGVDDPNNTIARTKKLDQSRYLAGLVDRLQTEDPSVNLALVGDFNTFEFSEGYIDAIGLIKGNPEPDDARTYATGDNIDLYDPDLINLITLPAFPASERYTYSFIGDRQVLDHILVNQNFYRKMRGFAIAHVNSNYPEIDPAAGTSLREDPTRPERFSDHDSPFGYFGFTTPALSSDFEVEQCGLLFDPTLQAYTGYLTIRNVGPFTINGPLQIALTAPVPGVSFLNRTGITADGSYYTLDASLAPGESRLIDVQIRNSAGIPPVYSANVYTGVF
ncbi:MAG TPA: hypothetical protein VEQ63_08385, partial [Bryobacteraceae bacterium]|nr:hypothetical protein [Bryobacteraceae bacterium]